MLIVIPKVTTNKISKKVYTKGNEKGTQIVRNNNKNETKKAVITEVGGGGEKSYKAYRKMVK